MHFLFRLILMIAVSSVSICAQQLNPTQLDAAKVAPLDAYPGSGVKYESVAQLKLASHKETYRVGEFIIIDAALLNHSKEPVFFLSNFSPGFYLSNEAGKQFHVMPYGIVERIVDASSYTITEPEDFIVDSSVILVGCDERAFDQGKASHKSSRDSFNRNLFVSRGSACLKINRPGTYNLSAEVTNDHVVLSPADSNVKTAVGKIRSNKLRIIVME